MDRIEKLSVAFLDDRLEEEMKDIPSRELEMEYLENKRGPSKRIVGDEGDIILHWMGISIVYKSSTLLYVLHLPYYIPSDWDNNPFHVISYF